MSEARKLKRKYPNIKNDFFHLSQSLKKDPITGNDYLGKDCYKVRMQISDKNTGESGGARVIIQIKIVDKRVYVLSVYDKSHKGDLLENELDKLLKKRLTEYPD